MQLKGDFSNRKKGGKSPFVC